MNQNNSARNAKHDISPGQAEIGCGLQRVCLGLTQPAAREVCIAGSFNDWQPGVTQMVRLNDGKWAKELALPPGCYEYRFVVDGVWVDDAAATELIPNVFGTANAVLAVASAKPATLGVSTVVHRPRSADDETQTIGAVRRVRRLNQRPASL